MLLNGLLISLSILCLSPSLQAAAGSTFLITAPLDIRPGSNFIIGIDILPESPPLVKIEAEIQKDNVTLLQGEGMFQNGSIGKLVLPQLPLNSFYGKYDLHVKGVSEGKIIFFNMKSLDFKSKSFSVFIETNSVFYKPAQEVKIRIVTFSADLKPYTSTIDIHVMDPHGNLIEQWLEEKAELGVVSNSFQLSDNPLLGDWSIKVKLHHQLYYQTFTVTQYVLPKFEVLLTTPSHYSIKTGLLEGDVTAKYTYGMPVKGKLTVTLLNTAIYQRKNNITKTFEINGFSKFSFTNLELKKLLSYEHTPSDTLATTFSGPVDVVVMVTEDLTGATQNQSSSIYVIVKEYYIDFYNYPSVLKPMLNFTTYVRIRRYDGRELTAEERENDVSVTVTQSNMFFTEGKFNKRLPEEEGNMKLEQFQTYSVPKSGIIHLEIPIHSDTINLNIKVAFLDSVNSIVVDDVFNSPNKMYLQIENTNQGIKVGIPFTLEIKSNVPLDEIKYLVVSRGQIVNVGREKSTSLTLNPKSSWTPEACLIVYHVMMNGTIINDFTTLSIQPNFENKISISWNKAQANPSDKVSLMINVTEPNSLVGLSVIDKSVKLLGDRQEMTIKRVSDELRDYSTTSPEFITNSGHVFEATYRVVAGRLYRQPDETIYPLDISSLAKLQDRSGMSVNDLAMIEQYIVQDMQSMGDIKLISTSKFWEIMKTTTPIYNPLSIVVFNFNHYKHLQYIGYDSNKRCNIGVFTDAILEQEQEHYYDISYTSLDVSEKDIPTWHPFNFGEPRIRSYFPETWIWKNVNLGRETFLEIESVVPDTITSWITNAFVISENLGFGLLESPLQLESFQPFFVSLNLPSYITRGEQFILEVVVFNYLDEDTEVSVALDRSDAFEIQLAFINSTGSQQTVSVPSQQGKNVFFPIKPIQLGEIPIIVKATSSLASDAVTRKLLVKAEGIEHSYSQTLLLELINNKPQIISTALNFTFPPDVVSGSEKAFISVVGDILGPSSSNLQSLIQLPTGCGEQNMIRLAPCIFIMEYLTNTRQLNDLAPKLISYMKEGYQRELIYQREDGSFSAFGNDDPSGSTWLSAFVLRCFLKARQFILVDPVVLHDTLTWLLKHQKKNGEFWEPGRVISSRLQGGLYSPVTLTAYVMAALIEYPGLLNSSQITASTNYLESQMNEVIAENYTLSLVTYALSLVGRNKAKEGLDHLNDRAEHTGTLRFWKSHVQTVPNWWQPNSADIEVASYVLLSHVIQNRVAEGIAVMKWLSQQRNYLGGYSSTQDTITALLAMSCFASKYSVSKPELHISVEGNQMNSPISFRINPQNHLMLQTKQIATGQDINVTVNAEGAGFAIVQLHIIYNLRNSVYRRTRRSTTNKESFDLGITVHDKKNINAVTLNVCTRYLEMETLVQTGMTLLQVDLLSGFTLAPQGILVKYPVKKVETDKGKVNIYFDSLNQTEICLDIPTIRDSYVGYTQDAFVTVIDYYEPGRRAVRNYNSEVMQKMSPCSFCKDECSMCLDNNHAFQPSSAKHLSLVLVLLNVAMLY